MRNEILAFIALAALVTGDYADGDPDFEAGRATATSKCEFQPNYLLQGRLNLSQRDVWATPSYVFVGGLLTNSPPDADYEFQFYDGSACSGTPFKDPLDVRDYYLEYESWMGDTPYWNLVQGRFGDGSFLLEDMAGWSIGIIDKGMGIQRHCCEIGEVKVYEHIHRRLLEETAPESDQN